MRKRERNKGEREKKGEGNRDERLDSIRVTLFPKRRSQQVLEGKRRENQKE